MECTLEIEIEYLLQINGIIATPEFRFAQNRKGERLRDALAEQAEIGNEREKLAAGWTEQDEASMTITGHEAVEPEPRDGAWQTALEIAEATKPAEQEEQSGEDPDGNEQQGGEGEDDGEESEESERMIPLSRFIEHSRRYWPDSSGVEAFIDEVDRREREYTLTGAGTNGKDL